MIPSSQASTGCPPKPRLRGIVHQFAFAASLPVGILTVAGAQSPEATAAATVFALGVSGLLGVSALYHRISWTPRRRRWLRRVDHCMIFVVIAACYTPFALLVLEGWLTDTILASLWLGVIAGAVLNLVWLDAPKWFTALVYVVIALPTATAVPQLLLRLGPLTTGLLLVAGLLSAAGAGVYALQRPDPAPAVFGYHEVFHTLVTVAIALVYFVVGFDVIGGLR